MKPEEMSNEELLELARAVFKHCQREQTGIFVLEPQPDGSGCWCLFDPLANPAHAWKVYKWIIGRYDRNDMDASDWTDGDETIEQVVLRRGVEEMRRIAVIRAKATPDDGLVPFVELKPGEWFDWTQNTGFVNPYRYMKTQENGFDDSGYRGINAVRSNGNLTLFSGEERVRRVPRQYSPSE